MPNAQSPMPNPQSPMPNAPCPIPNAQCPTPNCLKHIDRSERRGNNPSTASR
ncbi:MAG: hypothetical protein AAF630_15985 [Cyanobacteria bacterium P01_C01_bin.38]